MPHRLLDFARSASRPPQSVSRTVLRTTTVVGAAALVVTLLAACSSSSGSGGSSADTDAAKGDCSDGPVTLSVLRPEGGVPTDAQLDAYKATNDCVDFDVTEVPFGEYSTKLNVSLSSSSAPDIIAVDSPASANVASQGALLALDDYVPDDYKTDLNSADLESASYDDKLYSLAVQQVAVALFYNKDRTDAAGITVPSDLDDAWTWDEAKDAMLKCQATAGAGVEGLATSLFQVTVSNTTFRDQLFLRSEGDSTDSKTFQALSEDGTTVDGYINSPEAIEGATFYQGLFQGDEAVTSTTQIPNEFVSGNACFDLTVAPVVGSFDALPFAAGVSPAPYFTTPIVHNGAVNIAVPAKSKHTELAATAAVAMSTGDLLTEWANANNAIPSTQSSIAESTVLDDPGNKMMLDELQEWGQPRPVTPNYSQYDSYLATAMQSIAQGSDPKEALDAAVAQIDPLLAG